MNGDTSLAALVAEAREALKAGSPERACALLVGHKEEGWSDPSFLSVAGAACCMAGKTEEGISALKHAIEIAPGASTYFNLGRGYSMLGDSQSASDCYRKALESDPNHQQAKDSLAAIEAAPARSIAYAAGPSPAPEARPLTEAAPAFAPPAAPSPAPQASVADVPDHPRGPRTPEQIAMEEWDKEQELKQRHRDYIAAGAKYGAATGAIMMVCLVLFSHFLGTMAAVLGGLQDASFLDMLWDMVVNGLAGAVFGCLIGLVVAVRDGGTLDGLIAGALIPIIIINVAGRLRGADPWAITALSTMFGIVGAFGGAIIGWATATSIRT